MSTRMFLWVSCFEWTYQGIPSFITVVQMCSMLGICAAAIACEADANKFCKDVADDITEAAVSSCLW